MPVCMKCFIIFKKELITYINPNMILRLNKINIKALRTLSMSLFTIDV